MQVWSRGIACGTTNAQPFPMRHKDTARRRTSLHCNRAHVPIIRVVSVGMMQTDVDAEVDLMVLRVPPTRVDDLVCICGSINRTIGNAVVHAIMTIVIDPIAEAVRPVSARARVADPCLWRRRARRRRHRTSFASYSPCKCKHYVVVGIVRRGMIEDGFL